MPIGEKQTLRFGPFELDTQCEQLRKAGVGLKLQGQPVQILEILLEKPGQLVTREELRQRLWASDTFVDFDHSLNSAINKLRQALGDEADTPRYIETLPKRGYRFIGEVVREESKEEMREVASVAAAPAEPADLQRSVKHPTSGSAVIAAAKQHKIRATAGAFAVVILLGAAGFGVYSLLHRPAPTPFRKFTITQVTNTGKAALAAISPDGRYVLSVMNDNGLQSLWLRNVPTSSDTQVIPPSASQYNTLAFSPDGNYIYFFLLLDNSYNLYRAPILGGTPQTVVENVDNDIAFSPDGQHIAYVRFDVPEAGKYRIFTASLDGGGEKVLYTGSGDTGIPFFLAWSPSGREIAYSLNPNSTGERISEIDILDVGTGKSHRFGTFKGKFPWEIRWSPDGRTLFVMYTQTGANYTKGQIGFLRGAGGDIEPITQDTNRYATLTLSADGKILATVLTRSNATISVLSKAGRGFGEPRPILSQANIFNEASNLTWSADGSLLVSNYGRLVKLAADGKSQTQLLADSTAMIETPASSCGTKYFVLSWLRHGGTNSASIWRAGADGSSPLKLTDGEDFGPVCSPDQKWVYYLHEGRDSGISRVRLDASGKAEVIFPWPKDYFGWLSVSPDGKTLATVLEEAQSRMIKIALLEPGSSSPRRMLDVSHYSAGLQFTPDGKSVVYLRQENNVDNVWLQPLDGSAAYPITDFKSGNIWSSRLSPDGNSLALMRGSWESDVVLLQESKP